MTNEEAKKEIARLHALIARLRENAAGRPRSAERRILNQIVDHQMRIAELKEILND